MSARLKLLALFAACAAPVVLGWAAWYFGWGTGNPGNCGELIAPRTLSGPPFEELRGKWVLVAFDAASCDAYCERKLYFMRKIRTAQGKEQARVAGLPSFFIFSDTALRAIVVAGPKTMTELRAVRGIDVEKVEKFGAAVVGICAG